MKKFIKFTAALPLLVAVVFALSQATVLAQSTGLRINPRTNLTVRAGETQSGSLLVANLNREVNAVVDLTVVDFKSTNETGTPTPILEENADATPWSLKPFITVPKTVELAPGESKYVPFSVRIPEGQGAGSYYSAIKYDPRPSEDGQVVISGAPMQLIFVTVPGKATELLNLQRFGAYSLKEGEVNGKFTSIFVGDQPSRLAYLLQNVGNVAEDPKGGIIIKNMFGEEVAIIENANPKQNLALIDQTRRFDVCIDEEVRTVEQDGRESEVVSCKSPGFWPGMYTAEMSLLYGINGNSTSEINATTTFWYLPVWFLVAVLIVLAVLAYVILRVRNALVGHRRHTRKR